MAKKVKTLKKSKDLIDSSKKKRDAKVEKELTKKKKGKKDKPVSAEKPVKKTKKAAVVEAPVKKKKKKAVEEVPAPKKKKKGAVEEKPAKGSKAAKAKKGAKAATPRVRKPKTVIKNDVKPIKVKQNRTQTLDAIIEGADIQGVLGKKIEISERQEKKVVKAVMDAIERNIMGHVAKGGSGQFGFTNLFKIVVKDVPAKARRKGINPFTKVEQWFEAKPATRRVKARPMKRLKDAAL